MVVIYYNVVIRLLSHTLNLQDCATFKAFNTYVKFINVFGVFYVIFYDFY